jgi:hypothetical protein
MQTLDSCLYMGINNIFLFSHNWTDEDVDPDDIDERSDIDIIEAEDGGWIAVRTAAVEEQASACQLVVLIAERLQEHFFPFVEPTVRAITPLLQSPHEDVRYGFLDLYLRRCIIPLR